MVEYSTEFHLGIRSGARRSAQVVLPLVYDLVRPRSVVDVGCGLGGWLATFRDLGVEEIQGVDGDYVDRANLEIPEAAFKSADLAQPLRLGRTFDLAMSLEVAEHLPPSAAPVFVESLVGLAPIILFSAAIPNQQGVWHLNEQWLEYWVALFAAHDYVPVDAVRQRIWSNPDVEWWYRQNTVLFVRRSELSRHAALKDAAARTDASNISRVHPELFLGYVRQLTAFHNPSLRLVLRTIRNYVRQRLRRPGADSA